MKKLLLHTCCGPCAIYVAKELMKQFEVSLYFYNPNIQPEAEYVRRRDEVVRWSLKEGMELIESPYKSEEWFKRVKGLENEPEGGQRCRICYDMRLEDTARYASLNNFNIFTTTMTISPHKPATVVNQVGREVAEKINQENTDRKLEGRLVEFLEADWKKHDGFKIACKLSREEGFYRQDYCGCVYSQKRIDRK